MSTLKDLWQSDEDYLSALNELRTIFSNKKRSIENNAWIKFDNSWFPITSINSTDKPIGNQSSDEEILNYLSQ